MQSSGPPLRPSRAAREHCATMPLRCATAPLSGDFRLHIFGGGNGTLAVAAQGSQHSSRARHGPAALPRGTRDAYRARDIRYALPVQTAPATPTHARDTTGQLTEYRPTC